jgi:RES domain-containing protein
MQVYRIAQEQYAEDLTGNGAKLFGGRWNSEGQFALYTSTTRALALLEVLAHVLPKMLKEKRYYLTSITIPDNSNIRHLKWEELPMGWNQNGQELALKKIGDQFLLEKTQLILSVPSVVMPEENNMVLNPMHKDFGKIKISNTRLLDFDVRHLQ